MLLQPGRCKPTRWCLTVTCKELCLFVSLERCTIISPSYFQSCVFPCTAYSPDAGAFPVLPLIVSCTSWHDLNSLLLSEPNSSSLTSARNDCNSSRILTEFVCLFGEGTHARSVVAEASGMAQKIVARTSFEATRESRHRAKLLPWRGCYLPRSTYLQAQQHLCSRQQSTHEYEYGVWIMMGGVSSIRDDVRN